MPNRPIPAHLDVIIESERQAWSGRFPLDVVKFRNRRFDGAMSATRTWELWRRGQAVALLPYDPIADAVVLIEQFRLPALAAGVDPVLVELPAGLCEPDEEPAAAIRREMREETGLRAERLEKIGGYLLTPGGSDEFCHLFAGQVSAPSVNAEGIGGSFGVAAENEDIRVRVWPADAAIEAAFAGRYNNVITGLSLFWLAAKRDWLRETWRHR